MRGRGCVVALLVLASVALVPLPGRAAAIAISDVAWSPQVPAHGELVTIEADVSSATPLARVWAAWCVLPLWSCDLHDLVDPDHDGRWVTEEPVAAQSEAFYGARFNVTAMDTSDAFSFTPWYYVQFGTWISVDVTLTPWSVLPAGSVRVNGTAHYATSYGVNRSAPAQHSHVDVRIVEEGTTWSTTTDATGAFASDFTAPSAVASYTFQVTVSNRTIAGSHSRYLVVATSPTPDLAAVPGSLKVEPSAPAGGREVTISFRIENRGNAPASGFSARLVVADGQGRPAHDREFAGLSLGAGSSESFSTTWTAAAGQWTVTVDVDPLGVVGELSEANNRATAPLSVAPASPGELPFAILGVAMTAAVVAAAALLVYRWRARRTKRP